MKKKIRYYLQTMLVTGMAVIFLAGCTVHQMELTESGFLSEYSGLEEDEEYAGMKVYRNPDVNIGDQYTKVLIAPIQFQLDPEVNKAHDLDFDDRRKLSNYFYEQLIEGLIDNYEIVDEPGEGVMLFRAAITDILPGKVLLNIHWSTTLMGSGIGGASLEAEFVDSLTNERILSFVDARKGKTVLNQPKHLVKNYTSGLSKWGHVESVLGIWAGDIVNNLNQMRDEYPVETAEVELSDDLDVDAEIEQ